MEMQPLDRTDDQASGETPEDVAVLYSWANLEGARYLDFSADRREHRAETRQRAAEQLRMTELRARSEAEAMTLAGSIARREEREAASARASSQGRGAQYAEAEARRRQTRAAQPESRIPGRISDPYGPLVAAEGEYFERPGTPAGELEPGRFDQRRESIERHTGAELPRFRMPDAPAAVARRTTPAPAKTSEEQPSGGTSAPPAEVVNRIGDTEYDNPGWRAAESLIGSGLSQVDGTGPRDASPAPPLRDSWGVAWEQAERRTDSRMGRRIGERQPVWSNRPEPLRAEGLSRPVPTQVPDEAVGSAWRHAGAMPPRVVDSPSASRWRDTPFVVVYSRAGGVGKTSLVATLGRALSSLGEEVLLADLTSQGLLPFYFGASESRPGVVRTFSPPSGRADAPVHLLSCDPGIDSAEGRAETFQGESETGSGVFEALVANSRRADRVLMDLDARRGWIVARTARLNPTVLVPLAADMNSVIGLQAVERSLSGMRDSQGKALEPVYLLNQFDASLPLHLDVRELLRQRLGGRLLPFSVRRANGIGEALAEGMTVVDYDPGSEVARDYLALANWLRSVSAPAALGFRNARWSER